MTMRIQWEGNPSINSVYEMETTIMRSTSHWSFRLPYLATLLVLLLATACTPIQPNFTEAGTEPAATGASGISSVFTDTTGLWSVPVPTNWNVTENEGYVTLGVEGEQIVTHLLTLPGEDAAAAIEEAWQIVAPGFDLAIDQTLAPPGGEGIESLLIHVFDTGDDARIVQANARTFDGLHYIILFDIGLQEAQRRSAQVTIIDSGFTILGIERTNLAGVAPAVLSDEIVAEWEEFIQSAMEKFGVAGAAVGVVQDGEIAYAKGFGVTDAESQRPIAPNTHMMIGSTGKSMTTMLMGTLVDDGIMTWDTPAQTLYPDFAVQDPELSQSITMRNLVCSCTGVPRRDFEFIFNHDSLTASDILASLGTFEFYTDFGEAFQYSNQMIAAGGYIAGLAAELEIDEPFAAYDAALHERVFDPIGMENSTLSFEEVKARGEYAIPHSNNAHGDALPIDVDMERLLVPVAPAGSQWSTLDDMLKYMSTQLANGISPGGEEVISEENLLLMREPQVLMTTDAAYALGWVVTNYRGTPLIGHGGNTFGFTADFNFLPDADLGIVVLTNRQAANVFVNAVRVRLLEMLYGLPSQIEQSVDFAVAQSEEQLATLARQLGGALDEAAVEPFVGVYASPILGGLELSLDEGTLLADFGEIASVVLPRINDDGEADGFVLLDPPLAGLLIQLQMDESGAPTVRFDEGVTEHVFTLVE